MDDASLFRTAADTLAGEGWCVLNGLLTAAQTRALADECAALYAARRLAPARVGATHMATELRGDRTQWFDPAAPSGPQQAFLTRIDALRRALNRELMLGLVESEAHYAVYAPGARYARHLDRLRDDDARVLSAVFYLNEGWQEADGGALRLYRGDGTHRDILPHAGTLLLFLSARFEHEVLPATRDRLSIPCWMRQRSPDRAV
ncbi:2OG-Fe(II) oxygenase [Rhodanobacter thiooxydans]|uniref:2OG-Fe(II) oxygenase n=1 Tax=Rhodanobacter thiooxydans TaxID=416169 RepID=A0A154QLJ1_9GAMM|nr:2OG-Fe(II) oxygenase [Rhodanobacter thiooxydans]EIL97198.1 2OG-Fe(II) oxygenase family oxidoreductase [Rhodanobacter thiooxydans LCS2]KZC25095.1 2OG-Fe(II) oxygenase [Rhodanobacter thiooxydans]MCW0203812.1 2OG-Fe(II) oxygenase [Rhodanobacter thiooxydans]